MGSLFPHSELPVRLAERAIDLSDSDVSEVAWSRADALLVLEALAGRRVVVLGGDALTSVAPVKYAYANWHADRGPNEDPDAYVARSQQVAREYIERYPQGAVWFVLVLAGAP